MKKKIGAYIISLGMIFSLTACSGGQTNSVDGSWELTKGYSGDTEVTQEQLQKAGIGGTTFTFKDGKVEITTTGSGEVSEGTYTVEGDKVTISAAEGSEETASGSSVEATEYTGTVKDDQLTISQSDGVKLVFTRK